MIQLQRGAAIADYCGSKLCFIMFGGHSFCLANAASDSQRYSQSSNCERNPIDENVNPGLVLSNQLPALAMAPPFNTSSNTLSKKVPLHCTPSFSAHPASAGRPTYGILNPSSAQFLTTSCGAPGMNTNSCRMPMQSNNYLADYFQFGQNNSYQCPPASSIARHAAT